MKKLAATFAVLLAATGLVACGGGNDTTSSTAPTSDPSGEATSGAAAGSGGGEKAGSTVKLEADPNGALAYTSDQVSTSAGEVTIDFNNPQSLPHDVAIESSDGETVAQTDVISDDSATTSVDLKPGTYTYYCTVPGHREAGMEGTLTVK
jgi:plastocyanin